MLDLELNVNIHSSECLYLSPVEVEVLQSIKKTGTFCEVSKVVVLPYRNLWHIISEINKSYIIPLILIRIDKKNIAKLSITEYGEFLLNEYLHIEKQVENFLKQLNFA